MNHDRSMQVVARLFLCASLLVAAGCGGGTSTPPPGESPRQQPATPPEPSPSSGAPPAAGAPAGSAVVGGTVRYEGAVPPLKPVDMNADPGCAKKHPTAAASELLVLGDGNTMANVFVYVKSGLAKKDYPAPTQPVVLDQNGCRYSPHVLGIMIGQPLKILNSDGLLHNIHALPQTNKGFNRAMPASVTEAQETFTKEEFMFKIKCDVHPWMGSYVSVMSHPFFAVTKKDGQFSIANLPAGTYQVEAWHEKLGTKAGTVTLTDGGSGTLDFKFSPS